MKFDAIHWDFPKGYWYAIKELYFVRGMDWMAEKVLVVDDERDIADLLEVYLQNENYDVYKYYCGKYVGTFFDYFSTLFIYTENFTFCQKKYLK